MGKSRLGILMIVAVATFVAVAPAFAATGSGYLTWDSVSSLPGQGTSPHGGYSTTTNKCAVCHAVHSAAVGGELLLPAPASQACSYCHINTSSGYTQVYGGDPNNYYGTDLDNAHNAMDVVDGGDPGVRCTTCHSVHAAQTKMTANAYLTERLLVGGKTYTDVPAPNYDPEAQAPLSTDSSGTALSKWCAGCHFTLAQTTTYYGSEGGRFQTHIMTTATADYTNPVVSTEATQVAWGNSNYCASCHSSGYQTAAWPHYTPGVRFLETAADASVPATGATDSKADGVCLRCHVAGTGSGGVGDTY